MDNVLKNQFKNDRIAISVKEFARLINVSELTIYRQISADKIPHISIGSRKLIPRNFYSQFIEGGE